MPRTEPKIVAQAVDGISAEVRRTTANDEIAIALEAETSFINPLSQLRAEKCRTSAGRRTNPVVWISSSLGN